VTEPLPAIPTDLHLSPIRPVTREDGCTLYQSKGVMTAPSRDRNALALLLADAQIRGWRQDTSRNAPAGRWIPADPADTSEFTVTPPVEDFGVAVLVAHTSRGSLRLSLAPPADLAAGIDLLRAFLGWPEGSERDG
jgi:hypothetical protein